MSLAKELAAAVTETVRSVAGSSIPPATQKGSTAANRRGALLALNDVDLVAGLLGEAALLFRRDVEDGVRILRGEQGSTAHERQAAREMVAGLAALLRDTVKRATDEAVLAMK